MKQQWLRCAYVVALVFAFAGVGLAQSSSPDQPATAQNQQAMEQRITELETEVAELKSVVKQLQSALPVAAKPSASATASPVSAAAPVTATSASSPSALVATSGPGPATSAPAATTMSTSVEPQTAPVPQTHAESIGFPSGTTLNVGIDTYYEWNFNNPVGRVNLLRPYDVLSNEFSLDQASLIVDRPPDPSEGRRWGARMDLQFGQATDTLQGNPSNEPRPDIYRNVFQVYGTYIFPVGKGVTVDFGKWSSSLGIEGNYTKDQMNYSRSYWFYFLPFYHMGVRASIPITDKFAFNYWIVNGTNQVEATNGFKDELFGFTATPTKTLTWTFNYYLGQDHPDRVVAPPGDCPIPVQPGLCFAAIRPAPNGLTNIFDTYATWNVTPKLTFAAEGDYYSQHLWENAAPGEPITPAHVDGGASYVHYQFSPHFALASRFEYMTDDGGLFSGLTQALKENTVTFDYMVAHGFLMRYEWRRDYSNQPTFYTDVQGVFAKQQDTASVGIIWWWGAKKGSW
jgi:Putative beta-barrel porin-2, OmpL-like. bbp2